MMLSQVSEVQAPEQVAEDELDSAELTAVVGGTTTYQINPVGGGTNSVTTTTVAGTPTTSMVTLPGTNTQIQMTVNYTNNLAVPPPQPAFNSLLTPFNWSTPGAGAGAGGAMSVGAFLGLFAVLFL